jgi:hypothetical protein
MAEPSSSALGITVLITSLLGPVVGPGTAALLGPIIGPATLLAFGATAGSMLSMSRMPTLGEGWRKTLNGAWFVLVGVLFALAIGGSMAYALERWAQVPVSVALMPIGAIIGAGRVAVLTLIDRLLSGLGDLLALIFARGGK